MARPETRRRIGLLSQAKAALLKEKTDKFRIVSQTRPDLSPAELRELVSWLVARPHISREVFAPSKPNSGSLHLFNALRRSSCATEITWLATYLAHYREELRRFVDFSEAFHANALAGRYVEAAEALDRVEAEFGLSVWLQKNRIYLLQAWKGLDAQKQFAEEIWMATSGSALPRLISYFTSVRNEPALTPARFFDTVKEYTEDLGWPAYLTDYFDFHVTPALSVPIAKAENILRIEHSGTVIDSYETLLTLSRCLVTSGVDAIVRAVSVDATALFEATGDRRGSSMAWLFGDGSGGPPSKAYLGALTDSYFLGEAEKVATEGLEKLLEYPLDADLWVLTAKAIANVEEERSPVGAAPIQRLAVGAARLLRNGDTASEEFADLHKTALNLWSAPVTAPILGLIEDVSRSTPLPGRWGDGQFAGLASDHGSPFWALSAQEGSEVEVLGAVTWLHLGQSSRAGELIRFVVDDERSEAPAAVSTPEAWLWAAHRAMLRADFPAALSFGYKLMESSIQFYRRRGVRVCSGALLTMDQLPEAVSLLTSYYLVDRTAHELLPVSRACKECKGRNPIPFSADISVPILFDIYSQHIDKSFDTDRAFAYEDFLRAHKLSVPTSLGARREAFDRAKLVYFLRYVAVESVMDRSKAFRSSAAVLAERLAVCRLLLELDPASSEVYQGEIRDLLRRQMIQKRMHQIEQHKIYVDLDSLRRTVDSRYREMFLRFQDLRREHPDAESGSTKEVLAAVRKAQAGDSGDITSLRLPANPATELLKQMVLGFRDEFVSSPEHGLDKYLSVRIRHGTLAAQLRRPVESAKLITTKDSSTGRYKANLYWMERLANAGDGALLPARLAQFSSAFDKWIEDLLAVLQVASEPGTGRLFEFQLPEHVLTLISEYVTPESKFEQFTDYLVTHVLGSILETNLERTRRHIQDVIKPAAATLLDTLASDLLRTNSAGGVQELVDSVRSANTDLQVALDRVTAWFYRTDSVVEEPFSIADAVEISAEAVRYASPNFRVTGPGPDGELVSLRGSLLATLMDVFFIIFENVSLHSGLTKEPEAVVSMTSPREHLLAIQVTNDLDPSVVNAHNIDRVHRIKSDMASPDHAKYISREGGTGFHKLKKVLTHDLNPDALLEFGFADGDKFVVRFEVKVETQNENPAS